MATKTSKTPTDRQCESYARKVRDGKTSVNGLATELGVSWKTAKNYVNRGQEVLAQKAQEDEGGRGGVGRKDYGEEVMSRVVALREQELMSWPKIAEELGFPTPGTARRAYRNAKNLPRNVPLGRVGKGGRVAWKQDYPKSLPNTFETASTKGDQEEK